MNKNIEDMTREEIESEIYMLNHHNIFDKSPEYIKEIRDRLSELNLRLDHIVDVNEKVYHPLKLETPPDVC